MFQGSDGRKVCLFRAWKGAPIPLVSLVIRLFRDGEQAGDPVQIEDLGDGWFRISYVPSWDGFDQLQVAAPSYGFELWDPEAPSSVHRVDHDFRIPNSLRFYHPEADRFRIRIFRWTDWLRGRQDSAFYLAESALDSSGRWLTPVFLHAGKYVVAAVRDGEVYVLGGVLTIGGEGDYNYANTDFRSNTLAVEDDNGSDDLILEEEEDDGYILLESQL